MMILKAETWPEDNFWVIECKQLDIITQGYNRHDALHMLKDAIDTLLNVKTSIQVIQGIAKTVSIVIPLENENSVINLIKKRSP
jgi:predicted RNase H-like HicB family nuclease